MELKENGSKKDNKSKYKNEIKGKSDIKFKSNNIKSSINEDKNRSKSINVFSINKIKENVLENNKNIGSKEQLKIQPNNAVLIKKLVQKEKHHSKINKKEILTDYELNDLEYASAIELDKRNFFSIYCIAIF